jgi:UTP--glucose-1-phosphate uridylyltransferase
MKITKAIFPVAGLGSRFLPATKANPKEMLPIVDKPLIQYAVEEAVNAGLTHMIFITSSNKRAIEDHFDNNLELETKLHEQQKYQLLDIVKNIAPKNIKFTYVRQHQAHGLGHAILCAEHVVGRDSFAVLLADDLIDESNYMCLKPMVDSYEKFHASIIAIQQVPWADVSKYGIVDISKSQSHFTKINDMIEKPPKTVAPSNFAAIGRYVFSTQIFDCLKKTTKDIRGEIQLTDAIKQLVNQDGVYSYQFKGKRFDCGSKLGYLQAMVEYGMRHAEVGDAFTAYLSEFSQLNIA